MLSISLSLCDLPLFIAIDIFGPLYIIKLGDEHINIIPGFTPG
jgi:hypothetical protein